MSAIPVAGPIAAESQMWGTPLQPVGCAACHRGFLAAIEQVGRTCPICGLGVLEGQPALMRSEPPELVLPFGRQKSDLPTLFQEFVSPVWLKPDDLAAATLAQRAVPVLWPMWLVDGNIVGGWEAELGFDYKVESARESLAGGQWRSEKVFETRIRWEPRAGQIMRAYANVASPALNDHARWLAWGGEYPQTEAQPFVPEAVQGALVVIPDLVPEQAWPLVRAQIDERAAADCQTAADAQHVRRIGLRADYPDPHWTQLLLPAYLTYYTDDAGAVQPVLVNGVTGQIGGRRLASQRKGMRWAGLIGLAAAAILILGLVLLALGALFPPVALLGGLALLVALGVGVAALVPAIWPGQWNRGQRDL